MKEYDSVILIYISIITNLEFNIFSCACRCFYDLSGEVSIQVLCPLNWVVVKVLGIFWIIDSYLIYNVQIFSSILWAVFSLSGWSL